MALVKDFVKNQTNNSKEVVVTVKNRVTTGSEVAVNMCKEYYYDISLYAEPKIEFVKLKFVEGKNYMMIQFDNTLTNGSKYNQFVKNYVLEGLQTLSLKKDDIKDLFDNYKVELAKYLLKNKDLLNSFVEDKKEVLIKQFNE